MGKQIYSSNSIPPFNDCLKELPYGLGHIQAAINKSMIYPSIEAAGFTAFAFLSSVSQRHISVMGIREMGLNQYFMALGQTGYGKESLRSIFLDFEIQVKEYNSNYIGSELIQQVPASPQALHCELMRHKNLTYLPDEFGEFFVSVSGSGASHKQEMLGYLMELYTKSMSVSKVPSSMQNSYEQVVKPRVSIFGTSTGERMIEGLSSSHANSGLYNRFLFFIGNQDGPPEKRYDGISSKLSEEALEVIRWISNLSDHTTVTFEEVAWSFFKTLDQTEIEPLKFKDSVMAGRLAEQLIKLSAIISLSDKRTKIVSSDIDVAWKVIKNMYERFRAYLDNEGGLNKDPIALAYDQVADVVIRKKEIALSSLKNYSRAYADIVKTKQSLVIDLLIKDGVIRKEPVRGGSKLVYFG